LKIVREEEKCWNHQTSVSVVLEAPPPRTTCSRDHGRDFYLEARSIRHVHVGILPPTCQFHEESPIKIANLLLRMWNREW